MAKEKKIFFTLSALPYKDEFSKYVNDPRGWKSEGYSFVFTKKKSESTISIYFKTNKELECMPLLTKVIGYYLEQFCQVRLEVGLRL